MPRCRPKPWTQHWLLRPDTSAPSANSTFAWNAMHLSKKSYISVLVVPDLPVLVGRAHSPPLGLRSVRGDMHCAV